MTSNQENTNLVGEINLLLFTEGALLGVTGVLPEGQGMAAVRFSGLAGMGAAAGILRNAGLTVSDPCRNSERMSFVVPACFSTLAPPAFLAALRSHNPGLPEGALTFRGKAEETVSRAGAGTFPRSRMWVDITGEGMDFLRLNQYYLRTLVASVRLRPVPRGRHPSNNS